MVTLSTAYGLCSLIDQSGFLHINSDEHDCALVTLGRNIVMKYRLSDQKQLNNWSSIPQFTSKVVYDAVSCQYTGIITENVVKQWTTDTLDLDKVTKIKLKEAAHEILIDDEPVVLFKSGDCASLEYVKGKSYETCKGFLPDGAAILLAKIVTSVDKYLVLVADVGKNQKMCYSVRLNQNLKPMLPTLKTLKLRRKKHELLGSCFMSRENGDNLVTLWSDRFLYTLPLPVLSDDQYDLPIGQFKGVLRCINAGLPVAMTNLSPHHLAIYGGDPGEEGAVLAVYNLEFGMVQASTSFKLLQKPPRVWAVHGRMLVGLGQRLICVPYTLQTDSMAALVGTRPPHSDAQQNDVVTVMPTVSWEEASEPKSEPRCVDSEIQTEIDSLTSQGCPESRICEVLITQLMDKIQIDQLTWCLEKFVDIPEALLVKLLHFAFTTDDEKFAPSEPLVNGGKKRKTKKGILKIDNKPEACPITPAGRAEFLNQVLHVPHNPEALVPALRSGLPISECLTLLQYFAHVLATGSPQLEHAVIDWAITVIDAFYQQLVLGRYGSCVESVMALKEKVEEKIESLNECHELLPAVLRLKNKKATLVNPMQSKSYSVQRIQLYQ